MKTIIVIQGSAQRGKSSSIRTIYTQLGGNLSSKNDIREICIYNGKRIGLASQGDPKSNQKADIEFCIINNCEIVICASRTRGETVQNVHILAQQYGYTIIWTANYYHYNQSILPNNTDLNKEFADSIISLCNQL